MATRQRMDAPPIRSRGESQARRTRASLRRLPAQTPLRKRPPSIPAEREQWRMRLDQIGQEDVQQLVSAIGKKLGQHTILNILGTFFSILKTVRQ